MARKSPLSSNTNQRRNTKSGRVRMASSSFAIPERKAYRMDDAAHARNARARVRQHGTASEQRRVFAATGRKFPSLTKTNQSGKRGKGKR